MLQLIFFLINGIQPLLVPICFVVAWTVTILLVLNLWTAARDSVSTAKQMHQIPCTGCQFFTDDYRLKCTVRPSIANTEEAIHCRDYQPKTNPYLY
ncbi:MULTISPECIES: hypothetical protein [unclassified Nostoc]|uniref:hypothetical protein n=1 Tax=unclassified Nostoc TaxID=2593658 RepID=UPI002AD54AB6|nr:hypothetical protein [Nostoc sp. DedQUE03]MDZ7975820.1 hypothetical protein [Nostoc sp. DedQUE03]MDZ8048353.1 hypothetical protein [Nostoc sp. DedQUE02]